jgi:hypothetical protein
VSDESWIHINEKQLANIYQITVGHVKRLSSVARKRAKSDPPRMGRPPILTEDQEIRQKILMGNNIVRDQFRAVSALIKQQLFDIMISLILSSEALSNHCFCRLDF